MICSCGYIGCSGFYLKSEITKDEIIWSEFYANFYDFEAPKDNEKEKEVYLSNEPFVIKPPLIFNRDEYSKMVDKIISELPNYKDEQSEYNALLSRYEAGDRFRP